MLIMYCLIWKCLFFIFALRTLYKVFSIKFIFLQDPSSPWLTKMDEETEFLRIQVRKLTLLNS